MGLDQHFTCKTCKRTIYLGYASTRAWAIHSGLDAAIKATIDEPELFAWLGNQRFIQQSKMHEGHDFFTWSKDHCHFQGDDLYVTGAGWVPDKLYHKDVNFEIESEY